MIDRMRFSGEWRDYQARALDEMGEHLSDDRLHIVAAPGAGKTVLGLELVRRIGRPALIFAPSVAIRDQWEERLVPLFLDTPPLAQEVSRNLADPCAMTLATYQALDAYRRSDALDDLIETLNAAGPFTLVLDEAHHLRRAWWQCLDRLATELDDIRVVALTATPPYDASFAEWNRYETLCGPIDLEIGIPELVRNGDLCPHQDHLILSRPTQDALELLKRRRAAIADLQADIRADDTTLDWFSNHPWLTDSETHIEDILDAPEMLSAVLVLLGSAGRELPVEPLELLGVSAKDLPPPSEFWLERLLDGLIGQHKAAFPLEKERYQVLYRRLERHGLIEGGRVKLRHTRSTFRLLASSLSKFESIERIARLESDALGHDLRMVVLTDHIRAGELPKDAGAQFRPAKLGVVPIFESLRRAGIDSDHLGVLTGSVVIVPQKAVAAIEQAAAELNLPADRFRLAELRGCPGHLRLESSGGGSADCVRLITHLFARGDLRILVGTQSLLGEGWDAPMLNSLILASNTASFMLSNQMRGRAIRIDPARPDKVANIWHLATIEPQSTDFSDALKQSLDWGAMNDRRFAGMTDIGIVVRRFKAFEGIANGPSKLIESGLSRLGLNPDGNLEQLNEKTIALAQARGAIEQKWQISLGEGQERSHVREVAASSYAPRQLSWSDTLHAMAWSGGAGGLMAGADQLRGVASIEGLATVGTIAAGIGTLATIPKLAKATLLLWRNGSLERSLKQVTQCIVDALADCRLIESTERASARIEVRTSLDGCKDVSVIGVSRATERLVMQSLAEVLGPVQNPRYVLIRSSWRGVLSRIDYHAVPTVLAARKELAECFAQHWKRKVGQSRLIFARTSEGRRVLLRARAQSFAAGFQRSVDRRSAWL